MILDPINRPVEDSIPFDDAPPPLKTKEAQAARKEARKAEEEARRQRELNDLATVLSTDEGRAVILRLFAHCQPYRPTVISTDIEQYLLAEGRRSVSHWLIQEMMAIGPEVYPRLLMHHAKAVKQRAEAAAGAESAGQRRS